MYFPATLPPSFSASIVTGALSGVLAAGSLFAFFFAKREQYRTIDSILYWITLALIASVIVTTGGFTSPFLATAAIALLGAAIFGLTTYLFIIGLLIVYTVALALNQPAEGNIEIYTTLAICGYIPLISSFLIWGAYHQSNRESTEERSYRELASELSQVSGKSEIVINAIADGVIAVNDKGQIELFNPSAQRMTGWGHQDALGLDYKSVLKIVDNLNHAVDGGNDPVAQALSSNEEVETNELTIVTASGKSFMASIIVSPVGQVGSGAIVVFRDITKQKSEEREQAEFISTASHEMRTPIAAIEGYLGLALNPSTATIDDKARAFLLKAHSTAGHLGRLFQDLLDITKADDNRMQYDLRVVDLIEMTEDIVHGFATQARDKGLDLRYTPTGFTTTTPVADSSPHAREKHLSLNPAYYVHVDADHLREVLSNLVENAIKYTMSGTVEVNVTGDEGHAQVSVADTGIGIPKEDLSHLFQKFYRVDNSDTREIGGTGLGLYLCRKLVESMGGKIWVTSEYKQGSTFYVEFDRLSREEASRKQAAEPERITTPLTTEESQPPAPIAPLIVEPLAPAPSVPLQPAAPEPTPVAPAPAPVAPAPTPPLPPQAAAPSEAFEPVPSVMFSDSPTSPTLPTPQTRPAEPAQPAPAPAPSGPTLSEIEQNKHRYVYNRDYTKLTKR